jgi:hypothetical protein
MKSDESHLVPSCATSVRDMHGRDTLRLVLPASLYEADGSPMRSNGSLMRSD